MRPGDGDPRHGTLHGYTGLRCDCDECKAANTEQHRRYMRSHPEQRRKSNARVKAWRAKQRRLAARARGAR